MKSITVDNVTYKSVNDAAVAHGVTKAALHQRLQHGWSLEEALGITERPPQRGSEIEVDGVTYPAIKIAAEAYGLDVRTIRTRLLRDWTVMQAFNLEPRDPSPSAPRSVTVHGITYVSISAAARALGLDVNIIHARIERGWTVEEAFDATLRTPKHGYPGVVYAIKNTGTGKMYVGVTMRAVEERWKQHIHDAYADHLKNPAGGLREAIVTCGSLAFAIDVIAHASDHVEMETLESEYISQLHTLAPDGYNLNAGGGGSIPSVKHKISIHGRTFRSIATARAHLAVSIPYPTIVQRLNDGWTPEQAFGFAEAPPPNLENMGSYKRREITVAGVSYRSLAEACRRIPGAPRANVVQLRLSRNWSPEEAFNLVEHEDQRGKRPYERDVANDVATSRSTTGYRGVSLHKATGKWQAALSHKGTRIFVGVFDDPEAAHRALQVARRRYADVVATVADGG